MEIIDFSMYNNNTCLIQYADLIRYPSYKWQCYRQNILDEFFDVWKFSLMNATVIELKYYDENN